MSWVNSESGIRRTHLAAAHRASPSSDQSYPSCLYSTGHPTPSQNPDPASKSNGTSKPAHFLPSTESLWICGCTYSSFSCAQEFVTYQSEIDPSFTTVTNTLEPTVNHFVYIDAPGNASAHISLPLPGIPSGRYPFSCFQTANAALFHSFSIRILAGLTGTHLWELITAAVGLFPNLIEYLVLWEAPALPGWL